MMTGFAGIAVSFQAVMGGRIAVHVRQTPGAPPRRHEVAELLVARGWEVDQRGDEPWAQGRSDIVLVWENAYWFPRLLGSVGALAPDARPLVVVWHMEPLPQPGGIRLPWNGLTVRERAKALVRHPGATDPQTNWRRLRSLAEQGLPDVLAVASPRGQQFLAEHGVATVLAPYGWHPQHGRDLGRPRDLDVLFLGTLDAPRRRGVLRRLDCAGVPVVQAGTFRGAGTWGAERAELLSRARIVLNVPRRVGEGAQLRFVLGMSHGAAVVSEPITEPAPFVPGEHYLSVPTAQLADALRALLADEDRRAALAATGQRFVLDQMRLEHSLDAVLGAVERVQAARSAASSRERGRSRGRRIRPVSR